MTQATHSRPVIAVWGDVVCDCFIYCPTTDAHSPMMPGGTKRFDTFGGAFLPYSILDRVAKLRAATPGAASTTNASGSDTSPFDVIFGYDVSTSRPAEIHSSLWTYGLFTPHAKDAEAANAKKKPKDHVWRVSQMLGYSKTGERGVNSGLPVNQTATSKVPDVALLDDGNLGFRDKTSRDRWPTWLTSPESVEHTWIILKSSHPIVGNDLWNILKADPARAKRTISLISIEDLRRGDVHVSVGLSWERSATDLVRELKANPSLQTLQQVGYVIIPIGLAGVFLADQSQTDTKYHLIFDPGQLEGDFEASVPGNVLGRLSCFAAAIATAVGDEVAANAAVPTTPTPPMSASLVRGACAGLAAARTLLQLGHGATQDGPPPKFPAQQIAQSILNTNSGAFSNIVIPARPRSEWALLHCENEEPLSSGVPCATTAVKVARQGLSALHGVPFLQFDKVITVDRQEIEDLRSLQRLIVDYVNRPPDAQPLSIAVFGAPGSGKSFLVKQLAAAMNLPQLQSLEYNMSQASSPEELHSLFHQVRDLVLSGKLPLVFWDEFDSKEYEWLQHFLMPMQDGTFQAGQVTHPIGKCIFVFAGGTSRQYQHFGALASPAAFQNKKGPDFLSRVSGYLNVVGPNQRERFDARWKQWVADSGDNCYQIRRALLLRGLLKLDHEAQPNIDDGLLRAFLEVPRYKHGARSMQKLLEMVAVRSRGGALRRSDLPPRAVMELLVNADDFWQIMTRDDEFKREVQKWASSVHAFYREQAKREGWTYKYDMDFDALPEEIKGDNVAAAMRVPEVLAVAGLRVVRSDSGFPTLSRKEYEEAIAGPMELLAEAEHDGWMAHKRLNGWTFGTARNDDAKIHDALVEYSKLSAKDKARDRNSVKHYFDIVERSGFGISQSTHARS